MRPRGRAFATKHHNVPHSPGKKNQVTENVTIAIKLY